MSKLFSPFQTRNSVLRNRIVVSPMCQYSAVDGFANNWHLVHLGSRAVGGAGAIIQEATAVSPEGRISPEDLGLWTDLHIEKLQEITTFIKQHGALAGVQLAHAGRKASHSAPWKGNLQLAEEQGGWQTVAPSAIPFTNAEKPPHAIDTELVKTYINYFAKSAVRAVEAGYDFIEIHAAHGYLIHQFLSPLCNTRTDQYGGDFTNRIRFLMEIIGAVRAVIPSGMPLWVRISASDWAEGGWDPEQSVQLALLMKANGVDLVDCSSGGGVAHQQIKAEPGYQVPFAEKIRKEAEIATGAVGLITTARQCEYILRQDKADVILLAREMLHDPYFPLHAAHELGADMAWPAQYERARPRK
ncbi:NADH:flavin oxidoreductase/NADH oxidase [Sediminibacterium ginsengisoli]|uniref:2,4-dienoyl-CoA reductase n=1 Tax=Sediminibacterium ginsengisoli TaxID=413434 RepID=A0A1T4RBT2_9BACT|nr:NADH:flavin oxidoreductase/NADH oxidase [Sediminibacterium ginsengisoli]SKA13379.1 2,4-dienoyl-CoA reductase [Sediminibacterium ginsengisoli]